VESVDPSTADPEMSGSPVFTGAVCAVTTAVCAESAVTGGPSPSAVSRTRSVEPMSAVTTVYCTSV
jgi:hypothetical protein